MRHPENFPVKRMNATDFSLSLLSEKGSNVRASGHGVFA
jgi:hypothetical protein